MKSAYFLGDKIFEVRQTDIPKAQGNQVVIKNMACGICGTDVHIYHGEPGSAEVEPPVVLGHEYCGEITDIGEEVSELKVGDKVTVDPNIYCGSCEYCRNGKKQLCTSMEAIGVTRDGGFAQYSVVPAQQAFKLDRTVPFEYGAMAEPLACCIHGIDLADIKASDKVCIVGGGAIGLIMLQLAKLSGASKIALSEPNEQRRNIAMKLGADLAVNPLDNDSIESFYSFMGEQGADVVIECAGSIPAVESAFGFAKKGATVLLFSVPKVGAKYSVDLFDIFKKELTIKGSFVNPDTHLRAVELINSGKVTFEDIITHRYSLEELGEAIAMQMSEESIKVIVTPDK